MSDEIKHNPGNMYDWWISGWLGMLGMLRKFKSTVAIPMSDEQKERLMGIYKEILEEIK